MRQSGCKYGDCELDWKKDEPLHPPALYDGTELKLQHKVLGQARPRRSAWMISVEEGHKACRLRAMPICSTQSSEQAHDEEIRVAIVRTTTVKFHGRNCRSSVELRPVSLC